MRDRFVRDHRCPRRAQVDAVAVVDLLQVPAFFRRQTDLLMACGRTASR